jgi:hypothetical protein
MDVEIKPAGGANGHTCDARRKEPAADLRRFCSSAPRANFICEQVFLAAGKGDFPDPLCGSTTWRVELCSIFAICFSIRARWQHVVLGLSPGRQLK